MAKWKDIKKKPWFQAIAKVAPTLATALGGPFGGIAGAALKQALGLPETSTDAELASKVENATAADILAMKQADYEFKVKLEELDIQEQDLYLKDVQSAREREIAVRDKMPAVMAILGWVLWLFVVAVLFFYRDLPIIEQAQRDVLMYVLATSQAVVIAGTHYYLGSSRGSREKTRAFESFILDGKRDVEVK